MEKKRLPKLATKYTCTGCLACVDSCPTSALKKIVGEDGHYYPELSNSLCIGCLKCERTCPIVNEYDYNNNKSESKAWKAWDINTESRLKSTSGGVFTAIARCVIEKGGVVYGSVNEGENVYHIRVSDKNRLSRLQGSKYLQSDTVGIYKLVKMDLDSGRDVLFSGTGCQVAGLNNFLRRPYERLLTVDLICAGVPSKLALQRFCEETDIQPESISWRNKENGWQHGLQLTIRTKDDKILKYNSKNNFFGGCFLGGTTNRYSCYDCKFCGVNRNSTFTIGDFWGVTGVSDENKNNGVSLLISHGGKAEEFLRDCNIEKTETTWSDAISHNFRTVMGTRPLFCLNFERRMLPYAFKHFSYDTLKVLYAGMRSSSMLYVLLKLFKYPRYRLTKMVTQYQNKKLISKL